MKQKFKEEIRFLIKSGSVATAIEKLENLPEYEQDEAYHNEVVLISSRLRKLNSDRRLNIIGEDFYLRELSKINHAILSLLNYDKENHSIKNKSKQPKKLILWILSILLILMILLLALKKNNFSNKETELLELIEYRASLVNNKFDDLEIGLQELGNQKSKNNLLLRLKEMRDEFNSLHKMKIKALKEGNNILSYELTGKIHSIARSNSFKYLFAEFDNLKDSISLKDSILPFNFRGVEMENIEDDFEELRTLHGTSMSSPLISSIASSKLYNDSLTNKIDSIILNFYIEPIKSEEN